MRTIMKVSMALIAVFAASAGVGLAYKYREQQPKAVAFAVKLPNEITPSYLAEQRVEYNTRLLQIRQAVEFAAKTPDGKDRDQIIQEAVNASVTCQTAALTYNEAIKILKDGPALDASKCKDGIVDKTEPAPLPPITIDDTSIMQMRRQIAEQFALAHEEKDGLKRQGYIIRATAILNECRAIAVRKDIDPKSCVPD